MGSFSGEVIDFDAPRSQAEPDDSRDDDADDYPRDADDDGDEDEVICHLCDDTTVGKDCDSCGVLRCPFHDRGQGGSGVQPACEAHEEPEEA